MTKIMWLITIPFQLIGYAWVHIKASFEVGVSNAKIDAYTNKSENSYRHAYFIHKFAQGYKIQKLDKTVTFPTYPSSYKWDDDPSPTWGESETYRLKETK